VSEVQIEPAATTEPENPQAAPEPRTRTEPELLESDLLVEDVSIDGMCGVY
jgi:mycofactocin precursor